jgi:hypothetical protein
MALYYHFLITSLDLPDTFSKPAPGAAGNAAQPSGFASFFSVHAYRPYFNVDTSDVVERIVDSVFPFRGDFVEKTSHNPDMYAFHLNLLHHESPGKQTSIVIVDCS